MPSFQRSACDQAYLDRGQAKIRARDGVCSMIDPRSQPAQWEAWWRYFCGIGSRYWQKTMLSIESYGEPHPRLATPTDWPDEFDRAALDHEPASFPWRKRPDLTAAERAAIVERGMRPK